MNPLNWTRRLLNLDLLPSNVPGTQKSARHRISTDSEKPQESLQLVGPEPLNVKIIRRRGVKNLTLRFEGPQQIKATIPWSLSKRGLLRFLESKSQWLQEQQKHFEKWTPWLERKGLPLEIYYLLGQKYKLKYGMTLINQLVIQPDPNHPEGPTLWCHWPERLEKNENNLPLVEKAINRFFFLEARRIIEPKVFQLADQLQVPRPEKVQFRAQKSRWGSCSSRRSISLNRKLIGAPPAVIESVILHELCHLVHLNHSDQFWKLLESHCPHHQKCDQWLNEHQMMLY